MSQTYSEPPPIRPPRHLPSLPPRLGGWPPRTLLALGLPIVLSLWVWYGWRIEPDSGEFAVLIHKTGANLPPNQILATAPGEKGIQLEVLPEGRFFKNPYAWGWELHRINDIPAGKLGVLTRLYGRDLPPGQILAGPETKGIVAEVLTPGKYRINPYAYDLELFDAITIRPGYCGVVTSLVGADVLGEGTLAAAQRNRFLVAAGLKGVQPAVLDTGTYYLNPYTVNVVEVNLQSQRFEMSGEDAISFLTMDGFEVHVEGTIEYALMREKAAQLTHQVGEMEDILKKIILPRARGFSRIEGSKNPAKNYIMGDTRQKFQDNLEGHLKERCAEWGVAIKSVLIRNITPPDAIASVIRERELAVQNARKFEQQIEQAKSQAELTRQEMLAQQSKEKVEADTARIRAVIAAQQDQAVRLVAASQQVSVARLENDAATAQAAAVLLRAGAEQSVIRMQNEAQAQVLAAQVGAYGSGTQYARNVLYQKIGPRIQTLLSSDQADGLGGLLKAYWPAAKTTEVAK